MGRKNRKTTTARSPTPSQNLYGDRRSKNDTSPISESNCVFIAVTVHDIAADIAIPFKSFAWNPALSPKRL
jgi:hypothetical protein